LLILSKKRNVLRALYDDIIALSIEMFNSEKDKKPTKEEKPSQISDVTYPTQRSEEIVSDKDGVAHKIIVMQMPKRHGGGYEVGVFKDDGSGNWVEAQERFEGPNIANFQKFETLEDAKSASEEVSKFIQPVVKTTKKPTRPKKQKQSERRSRIQDGAYLEFDPQATRRASKEGGDGEWHYNWVNPDGTRIPLDTSDPEQGKDRTIGRVFGQPNSRVVEGGESVRDELSKIDIEETLDIQPEISDVGGGFGPAGTPMLGRVVRPAGHIKTSEVSDPSGRKLNVELQLGGGFEGDPEHFNIIIRDPEQANREISHEVASSREEAEELFETLKANIANGTTVIASSPYGQDILDTYGSFDPNRPPSPNDSSPYVTTDMLPNEQAALYRVIGEKPWQIYSNDMFLYADGTHQARIGDRVIHQYKGWRKLFGRDRGVGTIRNWEIIDNPSDKARIGYAYVTFEDGSWGVFSTDFLFLQGRSEDTANPLNSPPVNPEAAAMTDPPKPNIKRPFISTGRRAESTVRRLETEEKYTLVLNRGSGAGSRGAGGGTGTFITKVVPYVSVAGATGQNAIPIPPKAVAKTREAYNLWLERRASVDEYRKAMGLPELTSRIVTLANPGDAVKAPIWNKATGLGDDTPRVRTRRGPYNTRNRQEADAVAPTDMSSGERTAALEAFARQFNANRDNGLLDADVNDGILSIFDVGDYSDAEARIEWDEDRKAYSLQIISEGGPYGETQYIDSLEGVTDRALRTLTVIEQEIEKRATALNNLRSAVQSALDAAGISGTVSIENGEIKITAMGDTHIISQIGDLFNLVNFNPSRTPARRTLIKGTSQERVIADLIYFLGGPNDGNGDGDGGGDDGDGGTPPGTPSTSNTPSTTTQTPTSSDDNIGEQLENFKEDFNSSPIAIENELIAEWSDADYGISVTDTTKDLEVFISWDMQTKKWTVTAKNRGTGYFTNIEDAGNEAKYLLVDDDRAPRNNPTPIKTPMNSTPIASRFIDAESVPQGGFPDGRVFNIDDSEVPPQRNGVKGPDGKPATAQQFIDQGWSRNRAEAIARAGNTRPSAKYIYDLIKREASTSPGQASVNLDAKIKDAVEQVFGKKIKISKDYYLDEFYIDYNDDDNGFLEVEFEIKDKNGNYAGTGTRQITGFEYAYNANLSVDSSHQRKGIASAINEYMENWYIANGIKYIDVEASSASGMNGALVWALNGFNWKNLAGGVAQIQYLDYELNNSNSLEVRMQLDRIKQKAANAIGIKWEEVGNGQWRSINGIPEGFPTPLDLALIGWNMDTALGNNSWAGAEIMETKTWFGRKNLTPDSVEAKQNQAYNQLKKARKMASSGKNAVEPSWITISLRDGKTYSDGPGTVLAPYSDEISAWAGSEEKSVSRLSPPAKIALNRYVSELIASGDYSEESEDADNRSSAKSLNEISAALQSDRIALDPD
jgi:GNAT superfamily N-acetyltransferase